RDFLAGKGRRTGYLLGAVFGAFTPFCSCSSIPLFLGFTMARIPLGITMAFLITSPLINELAVVLLWGLLGWKLTAVYVAVGMCAGITGGFLLDAIHAERWLQPFILDVMNGPGTPSALLQAAGRTPNLEERHAFALSETRSIFRRVWRWVMAGVALGALLHGFVPQEWFAENMGAGQWWSVPAAVAAGIPLYTNVSGIVPVMESLLLKGLPLGTTLAFCMSTVAASLPEAMMLKQVMRWQLLAAFLGMLLAIFTLTGWLFNLVGTTI
ncbi:MAG: permease, partial [Mailhella sp.]|nr:permease [Mailhella sp.]